MKKSILTLAAAAAVFAASLANAAIIKPLPGGGADVRFEEKQPEFHDSDHARLISTTQEVKMEHGGEVLVTKRVFAGPDGQRFVKESRERIDR